MLPLTYRLGSVSADASASSAGPAELPRWILHLDMNCYFASIEEKVNPSLAGKPLVVTGDPQGRSVVATANYPAREFGIKAGMSLKEAKQLCPRLVLICGNPARYITTLSSMLKVIERFGPQVETASIDELYLEASEAVADRGGGKAGAQALAEEVFSAVSTELELPCSVGVAPNKLMAKVASGWVKPRGRTVFARQDLPGLLENLPLEKIPGIGRRLSVHLGALGIHTCGELGRFPVRVLRGIFGVNGERLHFMGQGRDDTPLVPYYQAEEAKSVGHSITLRQDTYEPEVVRGVLLGLSEQVGRRMRVKGYRGRRVAVTVRFKEFETITRFGTMKHYVDEGGDIYRAALKVLARINLRHRAVRLVGVSVSLFAQGGETQPLFEEERRRKELVTAMDALNDRFGDFTVCWASSLVAPLRIYHVPPSRNPLGSMSRELPGLG